jgi:hypothetical protein
MAGGELGIPDGCEPVAGEPEAWEPAAGEPGPGATRCVGACCGLRMNGGGTGVVVAWGRCENSLAGRGAGRSGAAGGGAGTPKEGRAGSAGKGWRGPLGGGAPGSLAAGAVGMGGATRGAGGAAGAGRDGTDIGRFRPGIAGADGEASGGWMAPPLPPSIGGRSGLKLGDGFSGSAGVSVPPVAALLGTGAVCGGVTRFVAGGLGRIGAFLLGKGVRPSSLKLVRMGGANGALGPFSPSDIGLGVSDAAFGASGVSD